MESDNLKSARIASDPVFKFKAEGQSASESSFSLDSVDLEAHTCYVSLESIESAKNLTDIIIQSFGQAMATTIDKIMLYGQYNTTSHDYDEFAPSGIMNDTNIHTIKASNKGYRDVIKAVRASNGIPSVLGMNAQTEEYMALLADDNGLVCFRIYSRVDCKAVRPTHIAKITGIGEEETL